ncbi:related to Intersectin 1 [Sporisorium scitamineum]|uniref:Related to Intersectin 1 n=1 Tax=Sporisorium scitamineum TaxID=49012 RepID=A0A127Z2X3_9BASI|nr:related to Intersectin 1 [Sporisorium scitamineum]
MSTSSEREQDGDGRANEDNAATIASTHAATTRDAMSRKVLAFVSSLSAPWDDAEAIRAFIHTLQSDEQPWALDTLASHQATGLVDLFVFLGAYTTQSPRALQRRPTLLEPCQFRADLKLAWTMLRLADSTLSLAARTGLFSSDGLDSISDLFPNTPPGFRAAILVHASLPNQPDKRQYAVAEATKLVHASTSHQDLVDRLHHYHHQLPTRHRAALAPTSGPEPLSRRQPRTFVFEPHTPSQPSSRHAAGPVQAQVGAEAEAEEAEAGVPRDHAGIVHSTNHSQPFSSHQVPPDPCLPSPSPAHQSPLPSRPSLSDNHSDHLDLIPPLNQQSDVDAWPRSDSLHDLHSDDSAGHDASSPPPILASPQAASGGPELALSPSSDDDNSIHSSVSLTSSQPPSPGHHRPSVSQSAAASAPTLSSVRPSVPAKQRPHLNYRNPGRKRRRTKKAAAAAPRQAGRFAPISR